MAPQASTTEAICTNYVSASAPFTFQQALAMERGMLDRVGDALIHGTPTTAVSIWQTEQAIILPSGMSQKHNVTAASLITKRTGWPVYERHTGGDVTPQFDGVLNISMSFLLSEKDCNIMAAYQRLTNPLISFLKISHGLDAYLASVKGAFCDGAHNVVVDGKKLAGTAQRWRRLKPRDKGQPPLTAVLGHIAVLCGGALDEALTASNLFFEEAGIARRINPTAHVTMAELSDERHRDVKTLAADLTEFINTRA